MTEHEAGRKLDALIAERVMGWVSTELPLTEFLKRTIGDEKIVPGWLEDDCSDWRTNPHTLPPYSSDIAAAWKVIEKINNTFGIKFVVLPTGVTGIEMAKQLPAEFGYAVKVVVDAPTFPLAVCRAALAMKDVDTNSTS